jgi:hypothetical protein
VGGGQMREDYVVEGVRNGLFCARIHAVQFEPSGAF